MCIRDSQSGDFEAEHTHLIKSGNRYLRYYLLEAANSVRRCDSEFRRYYLSLIHILRSQSIR